MGSGSGDCPINIDSVQNPIYDSNIFEGSITDLSEIGLTPNLFKLEFMLSTEVNTSDVSDLMRKTLSSVDCKPKRRELIEEIPLIRETAGLARKLLWKEKVKKIVERELTDPGFQHKVKTKEEKENISQTDAIFEVYADYIVERNNKNVNKALLWILKIEVNQISEFCAELFVIIFLQRRADPLTKDEKSNTTLHYAAKNGWTSIAKKLMEHKNIADVTNNDGQMPLEFAIKYEHDECASFLITSMEPTRVRNLFEVIGCGKNGCEENKSKLTARVRNLFEVIGCGHGENGCEENIPIKSKLSFYTDLLEKPNMKATVMAVLDKMIEPVEGQPDTYTVYYHILDGDRNGHAPGCKHFNGAKKSCLYKIASDYKEVVCHDVVRLLLMYKWNNFAKLRFLIRFIIFMFHTVIMTSALVLAARKSDPRHYDTNVDIFRGICEAAELICTLSNILKELYQLTRQKQKYFYDYFNYLDIGAILFILMIIPFRIVNSPVQWYFAALGYLCQTLRGFQYAAVFKSTGVYVQILPKIVVRDIIPFASLFSLFLFAFTGALYFSLRGEEFTTTVITASNCSSSTDDGNCVQNTTTVESSSLNIFPYLTEEYYNVLFTNLRVMFQGPGIIAEYFGPNGFKWLSIMICIGFLLLVISVLLNLLIAQMSNTYTNVWKDAQRLLYINRAWIVASSEDNDLLTRALLDCRKITYIDVERIENLHDRLEKWEAPPISHVCKELTNVHGLIIQQKAANEQSLKQVNYQLAANQQSLEQVNIQLRAVIQELKLNNEIRRSTVW